MEKRRKIVYEKAYRFAVRIVNTYTYLLGESQGFELSKQLLKCGTSIGANVAEANGAISETDFLSKLAIAYKECLEAKYLLSLLKETRYLDDRLDRNIFAEADEIARLLFSILKSNENRKPVTRKLLPIDHQLLLPEELEN